MESVVIVDEHALYRCGIQCVLAGCENYNVIDDTGDPEQALAIVRDRQPDIAIIDMTLPEIGGLEMARRLLRANPQLKVIALSTSSSSVYAVNFFRLGGHGFLTKNANEETLLAALETISKGERYLSPDLAQQIALETVPGSGEDSPFTKLSQRETQIMLMVVQGTNIRDIAQALSLSPKTIGTYRHRLFKKLGVNSDVHLTHLAIEHGLYAEQNSGAALGH